MGVEAFLTNRGRLVIRDLTLDLHNGTEVSWANREGKKGKRRLSLKETGAETASRKGELAGLLLTPRHTERKIVCWE